MKAIVSLFAKDGNGTTSLLAEKEINILDISQILMREFFAMIMLVDLTDGEMPFVELSRYLQKKAACFLNMRLF